MDVSYPQFTGLFRDFLTAAAGQKIAVIGHARPDGDCIGSQVALARALRSAGWDVVCINADPVPRRLQTLVADMPFLRTDDAIATAADRPAVFVDCADHARAGERLRALYPEPLAVFDHHLSNVGFARFNFIDVPSSATCEILTGLLLDHGLAIDALTAQALYIGIMTDTGQFRFASTTRRTFLFAAELVARGASPQEAGFELYERESAGKLKLLQAFLASLRLECGGRVCIGTLRAGIFEQTGTNVEDTEGLVDYARSIDGVEIGALIEERADGSVKASLRSKNPIYRMDRVAALFGGGGHACAAGLNLKQGAQNFHDRLITALAQQIARVSLQPLSS